jgi:hypothetical protein
MARWHLVRALLPVGALLVGALTGTATAAQPGTPEHTQFTAVWVSDPDTPSIARAPGLLNVPPGWGSGDAAVILSPGAWPDGLRDRLVAALLDSGAAVLEIGLARAGGGGTAALARDMVGGLRLLRDVEGAGLTVAIGFGDGGDAALVAERVAPADAEGFAAAVRLGPGAAAFASGAVAEAESWPMRVPLFCGVLAGALRAGAAEFAASCEAGLRPVR